MPQWPWATWPCAATMARDGHRLPFWFETITSAMAGAARDAGLASSRRSRGPGFTLSARVMSRSLGPVSVRGEDGLATVTCSLYRTHSLVAVASDEACAFG